MGMADALAATWRTANERYVTAQLRVSNIAGGLGGFARSFRMLLQSLVLGLGAYLVIIDQASGGVIIAGSILTSRALAPIDQAIANWKNFIASRESWRRLAELIAAARGKSRVRCGCRRRTAGLSRRRRVVAPPGENRVVVRDVSFSLKAGTGLGIVGPSASGKSSLLEALVGVWPWPAARSGSMGRRSISARRACWAGISAICRRTSSSFPTRSRATLPGSRTSPTRDKVIAAAEAADAHELIKRSSGRLPDADRAGGTGPLGRPAPADRAGARALRRAVHGCARRAELEPGCRGRGGADAGGSGRAGAGRDRRRRRASVRRARRRRLPAGHERRGRAVLRTQGELLGSAGAARSSTQRRTSPPSAAGAAAR